MTEPEKAIRDRAAFPDDNTRVGMTYHQWLVGMALAAGGASSDAIKRADLVCRQLAEQAKD